jgi:O-acetyl-ADP-ribose deacetylase (regulator of RNase III)
MDDEFITAFNAAQRKYNLPSTFRVIIHNSRLDSLSRDSSVQFDAIVSPANSFARLDGGFDGALSRAFTPENDYHALTRVSQAALWEEWRGFAPPGSCTLVDLDNSQLKPVGEDTWNCRYMALCPTMKVPMIVQWDCEVVYECIWALLVAIDKHNSRAVTDTNGKERAIRSIMMTPLATGAGFWSPEQWAAQTVLAMKHFAAAMEKGAGIEDSKGRSWGDIHKVYDELEKTHNRYQYPFHNYIPVANSIAGVRSHQQSSSTCSLSVQSGLRS